MPKPAKPSPKPSGSAPPSAKRNGRPGFKATPEQREIVELCAAFGIPEHEMVMLIKDKKGKPIAPMTLRKYFRASLDTGMTRAKLKVIGGLFKNATTKTAAYPGGIPVAQIFWLKCRERWKDRDPIDVTPIAPGQELLPAAEAVLEQESSEFEIGRRIAFALAIGRKAIKKPVDEWTDTVDE